MECLEGGWGGGSGVIADLISSKIERGGGSELLYSLVYNRSVGAIEAY